MYKQLKEINSRPSPFQFYTADTLWTDEYISKKMLSFHLNESVDLSSRNKDFIDRSAGWIISHFGMDAHTKIADFGCGPGLYTRLFAETSADVTGIDFSERSILYARDVAEQNGLNINYIYQNYLEFETDERFDLITMIYCDFCALSPSQRKTLLGKFCTFLKPGGSVLLDVLTLNAFDDKRTSATYDRKQLNNFWAPGDYYGFLSAFKYDKEKVTLDKYTIIEESRTRVIYNWLQYFSQESLKKELEENGFMAEEFYADVAGTVITPESTQMAIVAKKDSGK
jgi:2-polyprenyl-3-methyl-5-hydroxy-6-metoxy-1,4-benzoquinol methylase